jgi:hypothetical protein
MRLSEFETRIMQAPGSFLKIFTLFCEFSVYVWNKFVLNMCVNCVVLCVRHILCRTLCQAHIVSCFVSGTYSLIMRKNELIVKVKAEQFHYRPEIPWGFQQVETSRFQENRHMKAVRLSAVGPGHPYLQEIFLVLISIISWIDPSATVRPEGLSRCKMSNLPPYNL